MTLRGTIRRAAKAVAIGVAVVSMSGGFASAQTSLKLIDGTPRGVHLVVSATGSFDAAPVADVLTLAGITIGPCTMAQGAEAEGPILVVAESNEIFVHRSGGSAGKDFELAQGESVLIPAGRFFSVGNVNSDRSETASALLLTLTTYDVASAQAVPKMKTVPNYFSWPDDSDCEAAADSFETRFSVQGRAGAGATELYLGIGMWDAGATTKGYELSGDEAAFNLLVMSGGMPTAGQSSGLAVTYLPGDVASDSFSAPVDHFPFENPGTAPLIGIVFGTSADDQPVFVPAQ